MKRFFVPSTSMGKKAVLLGAGLVLLVGAGRSAAQGTNGITPMALGSRLELFVDDQVLERLDGCTLKLHTPQPAGVALRFDAPWEGAFCGYVTVFQDEDLFRCYYRGNPTAGRDGSSSRVERRARNERSEDQ